ncbi:Alpha-N-acetylglucosaminidase C-terminal [Trinorchestia longiramus]|nr:Alpha-N-acetylglucosaminidase C-terminal [Trinorchestia longiramus]
MFCRKEKQLYLFNALNQITLWGPTDAQILDYAVKQWAGVVQGYTRPRWQVFVAALLQSIRLNKTLDEDKVNQAMFETVEEPFTLNTDAPYPYDPVGDSLATALKLYKKYRPAFIEAGIPTRSTGSPDLDYAAFDDGSTLSRLRAIVGKRVWPFKGKLLQRGRPSVNPPTTPDSRDETGVVEEIPRKTLNYFSFSTPKPTFFTELNMRHILEPVTSWPVADYPTDLRDFLVLSCKRKLQYITSSIDKDQVLRERFDKVQTLQQKNVFLLVDEVQIRPTVSISGGLLSGMAENNRDFKTTSILITRKSRQMSRGWGITGQLFAHMITQETIPTVQELYSSRGLYQVGSSHRRGSSGMRCFQCHDPSEQVGPPR